MFPAMACHLEAVIDFSHFLQSDFPPAESLMTPSGIGTVDPGRFHPFIRMQSDTKIEGGFGSVFAEDLNGADIGGDSIVPALNNFHFFHHNKGFLQKILITIPEKAGQKSILCPGPQPVEKMSRPAHVYYYITGSSLFPMVEEEINGIFAGCIFGVEKIRSPLLYRNMFLIRQEQIRDFSLISPMVAARRKISLSGNPKHGFLFENWIICS